MLPCLLMLSAAAVAPTPPMGWNSWDAFGTSVREADVKANADYMAKHLAPHGWKYVVVDIQWYEPASQGHGYREGAALTMDEQGRLIPAANKFPSGFKSLADYVHAQGLKFGIHIMRGVPRQAAEKIPALAKIADRFSLCPWNPDMYGIDMSRPGAQAYYDSMVKQYADWGVDFIKADDEIRPAHHEEIHALHLAIEKSKRPMVLSLSPGPARVEDAAFLAANANMWRVSDDLWDDWRLVRQNFILISLWGGLARPGAWPDGDMLPLGRLGNRASRLTQVEQRTLMSLWAIAQSPLIFGGNLPENDEFTNSLLTNDEAIDVNQHGANAREVYQSGSSIVWTSDARAGKNLGVFNIGDRPQKIKVVWRSIGLPAACRLRDLWAGKDLGAIQDEYTFDLPPHGSGLYRLTAPGKP